MKRYSVLALILGLFLLLAGCGTSSNTNDKQAPVQPTASENATQTALSANSPKPTAVSGKLTVHFINVGQGDSIFLQLPNYQTMLVDAGPNEFGSTVVSYLQKQGVNRIDYLVATHPHEDHIGGMDLVINSFDIGKIYMPRVTTTTKTFEDVLLSIQAKGLKITPARAGIVVLLDQSGLKINFLAPCGSRYEDLNNWSAVLKVQYGGTSFLLTGDVQSESEQEMLASGANLKADVLKVGHHGSHSSTTAAFLKAVSPKYAVISVGAGNDYGHPHQETLAKLVNAGVKVYRADRDGTVVFVSDGKTLTVRTLGDTIVPRAPDGAAVAPVVPSGGGYIGNKNSKKFHRPTCSSLPAPRNRIYFKTREEAVNAGYVPCKRCNP